MKVIFSPGKEYHSSDLEGLIYQKCDGDYSIYHDPKQNKEYAFAVSGWETYELCGVRTLAPNLFSFNREYQKAQIQDKVEFSSFFGEHLLVFADPNSDKKYCFAQYKGHTYKLHMTFEGTLKDKKNVLCG